MSRKAAVLFLFAAILATALNAGPLALAQPSQPSQLAQSSPAAAVPSLRVGLAWGQATVRAGAPGPFSIVDAATGGAVLDVAAACEVEIGCQGGSLVVTLPAGWGAPARVDGAVRLEAPGGRVTHCGAAYRGALEVSAGGDGLLAAVNVVPLEDYLCGVVPDEVPPDWPAETLKAQAVAARTYALYTRGAGRHAAQGFDLCATVDCQVYGGIAAEDARATAAVDATRGEVLRYGSELIQAYFHASSGGHTENSENVWGAYQPYLRGVPDFDQDSPRYNWETTIALADAEALLRAAGMDVGRLYDFSAVGARGVSGRAVTVELRGANGSLRVKANTARLALGLYSTLYEQEARGEAVADAVVLRPPGTAAVVGADGVLSWRDPAGAAVAGAGGAGGVVTRGAGPYAVGRYLLPAAVTFRGHGRGHGIGMSQWGARALAADHGYTYRQVLEYYYQGARVEAYL